MRDGGGRGKIDNKFIDIVQKNIQLNKGCHATLPPPQKKNKKLFIYRKND